MARLEATYEMASIHGTALARGARVVAASLFLLAAFVLSGTDACRAEKKSSARKEPLVSVFDSLKAEYLHLRNTDVKVARIGEWEALAGKFELYVDKNPRDKNAPSALFNAAILYEQIFRNYGGEDRLRRSCSFLERLDRDYPVDALADDALVRRGDMLLYDMNDSGEAEKLFQRVLKDHQESDMREVARARLASLESGEYRDYLSAKKTAPRAADPGAASRKVLVVIDPGHGGEDFGAVGLGGLLEKDVALAVALELEKLLLENKNITVRLTRRKDSFVPLAERIQLANDYEADLFISIHTNASVQRRLSGIETYYLDSKGDQASRLLVERENSPGRAHGEAEDDLQFMLGDLIQNAKLEESIVLANVLHRSVVNEARIRWDTLKDLGVRKAPFYVLVGAHMPCVLTELFFIDNEIDGFKLGRKEFRQTLAGGLRAGIIRFLERQGLLKAKGVEKG